MLSLRENHRCENEHLTTLAASRQDHRPGGGLPGRRAVRVGLEGGQPAGVGQRAQGGTAVYVLNGTFSSVPLTFVTFVRKAESNVVVFPISGILPCSPYCAYALVKSTAPVPSDSVKVACVVRGMAKT